MFVILKGLKGSAGMSRSIKIMTEDLARRIAAGEVIERPASIVKELIENALDADATSIEIVIDDGGKRLIRVTDNGNGISPEETPLAFERHATSKIDDFDDLLSLDSFGFRGEALPSIAAVARVEMATKSTGSLAGTRITVEGGIVTDISQAGVPEGTTVTVRDLFFTTPVRKKFLRRNATELSHCLDRITKMAVSNPFVRITVIADGRRVLFLPPAKSSVERIASIIGGTSGRDLLAVDAVRDRMHLHGVVSHTHITKTTAKSILSFVNRRSIRDATMRQAVLTAYRGLIDAKRYPAAVILLEIPPDEVDVNVHPAKEEVRFKQPKEIFNFILESLKETIGGGIGISECLPKVSAPQGQRIEEAVRRYVLSSPERGFAPQAPQILPQGTEEKIADLFGASTVKRTDPLFSALKYFGQIAQTYLVFTDGDNLIIVDQHAAHERIVYERLASRSRGMAEGIQHLVVPEILDLTPQIFVIFEEFQELFHEAGVIIEPYGSHSVVVKAVPPEVPTAEIGQFIGDMLEEAAELGRAFSGQSFRESLWRIIACKSAIKAGHILDGAEAERLCQDLDAADNASTCPHGRPVFVRFGLGELERLFRRK